MELKNNKSNIRIVKQGVPQDEVISSQLVNPYFSGISRLLDDTELITYPASCTLIAFRSIINDICYRFNNYLVDLKSFFAARIWKYIPRNRRPHLSPHGQRRLSYQNVQVDDVLISTKNYPMVPRETLISSNHPPIPELSAIRLGVRTRFSSPLSAALGVRQM